MRTPPSTDMSPLRTRAGQRENWRPLHDLRHQNPQPHLIALLQLLNRCPPVVANPANLRNLRAQRDRIDEDNALVVHNPDT